MRNPVVTEELEDTRGTARIELGERIIEQDERGTANATKSSGLEQTKRDRRRSLLPRGAKCTKRMAPECELEVIAMRPRVCDAAPQIVRSVSLERVGENSDQLGYRDAGPDAPCRHR